jgi:methionyl-tRNA formyltransferase
VKVVFLAAAEPVYLPAFFDHVLGRCKEDTECVYTVPPLYRGQTAAAAAWRYFRTFGAAATVGLIRRVTRAKLSRASIARTCARHGVRHGVVADVNAPGFVAELARGGVDAVVSVSCPQIFKRDLLATPKLGCLNVHGALLPQYRGVMPSFWMLANGVRQAGVTIYFMSEEIDAGEIAAQRAFEVIPGETLDAFLRRSKRVAAELLVEVVHDLKSETVPHRAMDMSQGSYYSWPDRTAVRRLLASGHRIW